MQVWCLIVKSFALARLLADYFYVAAKLNCVHGEFR